LDWHDPQGLAEVLNQFVKGTNIEPIRPVVGEDIARYRAHGS
jgi:hypothetical protein